MLKIVYGKNVMDRFNIEEKNLSQGNMTSTMIQALLVIFGLPAVIVYKESIRNLENPII